MPWIIGPPISKYNDYRFPPRAYKTALGSKLLIGNLQGRNKTCIVKVDHLEFRHYQFNGILIGLGERYHQFLGCSRAKIYYPYSMGGFLRDFEGNIAGKVLGGTNSQSLGVGPFGTKHTPRLIYKQEDIQSKRRPLYIWSSRKWSSP